MAGLSFRNHAGRQFQATRGGMKKSLRKDDAELNSIEVHRRIQPFLDFTQGLGREAAGSLGQFGAVQRGHLMTHGKARFRQTGSPARYLNDGRSALALR